MKITITSSCEDSSIRISSTIDVERNSNYSLNAIISFGNIQCFHFFYRMLYMWKIIISDTKMSDWGWSINGNHKLSSNHNINAFFGWNVTNNF